LNDRPRANRAFARRVLWLALLGYWAAMFIGTHLPVSSLPESIPITTHDRWLHFLAFAGLAMLLAFVMRSHSNGLRMRHAALVILICMIYASVDEWTQGAIQGREPSLSDLISDFWGAMTGIGLVWLGQWAITIWTAAPRRSLRQDS